MAIKYLKKSPKTSSTDDTKTTEIVKGLLKDIETNKEQACIDLTKKIREGSLFHCGRRRAVFMPAARRTGGRRFRLRERCTARQFHF